jgi:hypothetical protein
VSARSTLLRTIVLAGASAAAIVLALRVVHTQPSAHPGLPARLRGLVCAQAFKLDQGYEHAWRAEHPWVQCGWILVLEIDPDLASVRDELEPVMFVGSEVAERTNPGDLAGRRVVIVPSIPDANGWPALDPLAQPMWLGESALPEQLTLAAIRAQRTRAEQLGITAFPHNEVANALDCGDSRTALADRSALQRHVAQLIKRLAPAERDFADGLLSPPVY